MSLQTKGKKEDIRDKPKSQLIRHSKRFLPLKKTLEALINYKVWFDKTYEVFRSFSQKETAHKILIFIKLVDKTNLSRSKCFQFPNFWHKKTNNKWHKTISVLFTN